jgi:integrase
VAIEAWAAELIAAGHGWRAVEIAVQTLRAMLSVALDAGMIASNPAARVRLPPAPPPERTAADRVVDLAGAERLRAACRDVRQETIIRAMVEAGLRRGVVCGLAWPDVRLDERRIIVRQAVYQNSVVGKIVRPTKTARVGRVPISDEFVERLREWHARSVGQAGADASGLVWPGRDGGPMSPSSVTHLVAKVGKRAGLVDAKGRHVAHGHGLRHSAGSIALSEGVPLTVVAATLRHSRPSFTAQRYSHLLGDAELDRFASAHSARTVRETVRETAPGSKNPIK